MVNGGGPPERILSDADYQTIKGGDVITQGTYEGCVLVDETYYWVEPHPKHSDKWALRDGVPGEDQCKIGAEVWAMCKNGGTLTWDSENEWWVDQWSNRFRWAGWPGGEISLVTTGS